MLGRATLLTTMTTCLIAVACQGGSGRGAGTVVGACGAEQRPQLDCESEIGFDSRKIEGGFSAFGLSASAKTEVTALRQVDDAVKAYVVGSRRVCDEYNKCVLDKAQYATRSENLRRRLSRVPELYDHVREAHGDARAKVVADAYEELVPDDQRVGLSIDFSVMARLADEQTSHALRPGARLATGSRVSFKLRPSRAAHVYIFQKTPKGETTVLFPDARIATKNPIQASAELSIPPDGRMFRLNDKDVGTERIFIVASLAPLDSLASALERVGAGDAEARPLRAISSLQAEGATPAGACPRALELEEGAGPSPCVRRRGLRLEDVGEVSAQSASLRAKSEAADSMIVQVFQFEHAR